MPEPTVYSFFCAILRQAGSPGGYISATVGIYSYISIYLISMILLSSQIPPEAMLVYETQSKPKIMEQTPENLSKCMSSHSADYDMQTASDLAKTVQRAAATDVASPKESATSSATKIKLSFSVDRLLSDNASSSEVDGFSVPLQAATSAKSDMCCENLYACCTYPHCYVPCAQSRDLPQGPAPPSAHAYHGNVHHTADAMGKLLSGMSYMEYKSVVRPMPVRAIGSSSENVTHCTSSFPSMASSALLRFHQQQQHKPTLTSHASLTLSGPPLMTPLNGLKSLQLTQQNRFLSKPHNLLDLPTGMGTVAATATPTHNASANASAGVGTGCSGNSSSSNSNNNSSNSNTAIGGKRKRSWSRAVFTNLQRKGLEIQFQQQKYITKPDRRKLAARLNLTDAQVKVWFQNRRMKWRHTRENLKSGQEKQPCVAAPGGDKSTAERSADLAGYSTDGTSSAELSDNEDDDGDEIDVVE